MSQKITAQVGQIIEVNGKSYRATEGGFEPVVKGPLGGELKRLGACRLGDRVTVCGEIVVSNWNGEPMAQIKIDNPFNGGDRFVELSFDCPVEINIPPRPTFTPMSAGEAARIPNMAGRWIAVKVDSQDGVNIHIEADTAYLGEGDQILLIEGVDL